MFIILNFRLYKSNILFLYGIFYFTNYFSLKITINTNFFDIINTVYLNDFYWNNFFYIWTQFFVLPLLFILLITIYNSLFSKTKNSFKNYLNTYILILIVWWINDYYNINQTLTPFLKNIEYFYNNLLNNPLNKYHPMFFFSSYIYFISIFKYSNVFLNIRNIHTFKNKTFSNKINVYWLIILNSLYLGSWWAVQEGSWGGWWNWDASEVFGLIILTFMLILLHKIITPNQLIHNFNIYIYLILTIFIYLSLQMSYTLTSHNFGLSIISYGYVNTTFTTLLILNTLLFINTFNYLKDTCKYTYIINNTKIKCIKTNTLGYRYLMIITLTYFLLCIYIISFIPIFNNILWTSLNTNLINTVINLFNLKTYLLIVLILLISNLNTLLITIYTLNTTSITMYIIPITQYLYKTSLLSKFLHKVIIIPILVIIFFSYVTTFMSWELTTNSTINTTNIYSRSTFRTNLTFENSYILNTLYSNKFSNVNNPTSFFWFTNNLDTQFFELTLDTNVLKQVIYNHTYLYSFKATVIDNLSLVPDIVFFVTYLIFLNLYTRKCKIIF
jgi:cytochrome c biogenesis factor